MREERDMGVGAKAGKIKLGLLLCVAAAMLAVPSTASADLSFCPPGEGAGQCGLSKNVEGRSISSTRSSATDFEMGRVYLADTSNFRIDVFKADGTFLFAFGWGVDTGSAKMETCTAASGCQAGIPGAEAGQFYFGPGTIAVDNVPGSPSQHDIYVGTDRSRVQKFNPDGSFELAFGWGVDTGASKLETCTTASGCQAGIAGPGECQLGPLAEEPLTVGPGGNLFVGDSSQVGEKNHRVEKFSAAGACGGETVVVKASNPSSRLTALAVDASEDAYVDDEATAGLRKYDLGAPEAPLCDLDTDLETRGLGLDDSGRLFAVQREGDLTGVTEYDAACKAIRRFGYQKNLPYDVDPLHSLSGDFFLVIPKESGNQVHYVGAPPSGPVVGGSEALSVGNTKVTVRALINPEGKATEYHFEYVDDAAFDADVKVGGDGFEGPGTKETESLQLEIASGKEIRLNPTETTLLGCPEATKALIDEGKCLKPETEYHWRVVATNADGKGPIAGPAFVTKQPLEIKDVFATEVSTDTASLSARVNPLGIPATGYFEYVDDVSYQANGFDEAVKVPDIDAAQAPIGFGSSEASTKRSAILYPLAPATTYHYRLVVTNPLIEGSRLSAEKTFRTYASGAGEECPENEAFRTGPSAFLPDCRAYEMVSPVDKENGDIEVLNLALPRKPAVLEQSAASGDRLAYGSQRAFGDAVSAPFTSQYIAARDPEAGWTSHAINPPRAPITIGANAFADFLDEYQAFSDDLCEGWIKPLSDPPLAEGALPGYYNLYRRTDQLCGGESYEAIVTAKPENLVPEPGLGIFIPELQGHSADGSVTAFVADDNLEGSGAPPQPPDCEPLVEGDVGFDCVDRLYVKGPGEAPRFACVLPDGEAIANSCSAGTENGSSNGSARAASVTNALSADGERLFFTASPISGARGEGKVYLRSNPLAQESAHLHGEAVGTGDLVGPATCTGNLSPSTTVKKVTCSSGALAIGQELSAEGIAAGTTILKIEEPEAGFLTLTLSKAATKVQAGAALLGVASAVVANAKAESGAFAAGQQIRAPGGGIPDETTIVKVEESKPGVFRLTLSAKATRSGAGAALRTTSACTEADKACTIPVSAAAEKQLGASDSHFWAADPDGTVAIFTTGHRHQGEASLYEFDVADETAHEIAGGVRGILGASEDLSRIYLASEEVLTGAEENGNDDVAVAGEANLYLYEAGATGSYRFVATLGASEAESEAGAISTSALGAAPYSHTSRVSPDGLHAAFGSERPLTGYDNTDAGSPEACGEAKGVCDEEAFVYDAESGELRCASCNSSGARPVGSATLPAFEKALYAPRVLADDGSRLFFESRDSLAARDTNGNRDVYQWELAGAGGCDEGDAAYSAPAGGCIDLISSGQSKKDTRFVDASPSGDDVFFLTSSSLVAQDESLVDIYDARVGGGFPPPAPPAAECEGEACQGTPEPPNDPTPASESFEGAGNVREEAAIRKPAPCAKGKVKRHGKCVAKKHRKHRAKRNRRAAR